MACLRSGWILALEPERFENRPASARHDWGWLRLSSHAQVDFRFNDSGLKRSPFFQILNTIAAILRAKVNRAMAGFIPRVSKV